MYRFKLKLFPKLFFAFLLTTTLLVIGMAWSVNWTLKQGLNQYIHQQEMAQLDKLIPVFIEIYHEYGDWDVFHNPRVLRQALRSRLSPADKHLFADKPPPRPEGHPPHAHHYDPHADGDKPPPPPPRFLSIMPRLHIFTPENQLIVGRDVKRVQQLRPLYAEEELIGWVGISQHRLVENHLAHAFYSQQTRHYVWIALLALLLSTISAWLLVRQLVKPVQCITQGTQALSQGDYQTHIDWQSSDELGQLARDFNHLAQTLAQNESSRRQWIADISHELRTPLAVLRGEIEAMQDGIRPANTDNIKSLHVETLRLAQLVDDLYDLSLSDMGALDYRRESVNVVAIVNETIEHFSPRLAEKNIHLPVLREDSLLLSADAGRLRQLFANLLENSLRYTDAGGQIRIQLTQRAEHIDLCFEDSAPSVPDEALSRLFERLYRVDKSRSREFGGSGLGLSICANIVQAHHGEIHASHSNLGGLAIQLRFPLPKS